MSNLFKFRSIADRQDFERARKIIETGEFWCSKLWEMNDPMEGVYAHATEELEDWQIGNLFSMKNNYVMCSFSGEKALIDPLMWGYYASGFKGISIEVEVEDVPEIRKVSYVSTIAEWNMYVRRYSLACLAPRVYFGFSQISKT